MADDKVSTDLAGYVVRVTLPGQAEPPYSVTSRVPAADDLFDRIAKRTAALKEVDGPDLTGSYTVFFYSNGPESLEQLIEITDQEAQALAFPAPQLEPVEAEAETPAVEYENEPWIYPGDPRHSGVTRETIERDARSRDRGRDLWG